MADLPHESAPGHLRVSSHPGCYPGEMDMPPGADSSCMLEMPRPRRLVALSGVSVLSVCYRAEGLLLTCDRALASFDDAAPPRLTSVADESKVALGPKVAIALAGIRRGPAGSPDMLTVASGVAATAGGSREALMLLADRLRAASGSLGISSPPLAWPSRFTQPVTVVALIAGVDSGDPRAYALGVTPDGRDEFHTVGVGEPYVVAPEEVRNAVLDGLKAAQDLPLDLALAWLDDVHARASFALPNMVSVEWDAVLVPPSGVLELHARRVRTQLPRGW